MHIQKARMTKTATTSHLFSMAIAVLTVHITAEFQQILHRSLYVTFPWTTALARTSSHRRTSYLPPIVLTMENLFAITGKGYVVVATDTTSARSIVKVEGRRGQN